MCVCVVGLWIHRCQLFCMFSCLLLYRLKCLQIPGRLLPPGTRFPINRPTAHEMFRSIATIPSFVLADSASDHLAVANSSPMSAFDLCQQVVLDLAWLVFEVRWVKRKTMRVLADSARLTFGAVFVC